MADINAAAKQTDTIKIPKLAPTAGSVWKPKENIPSKPRSEMLAPQHKAADPHNLPDDPAYWPEEWRYEFVERSGMLFNTGVTWEEADKTAEALVREHHAEVSQNGQLSLLEDNRS